MMVGRVRSKGKHEQKEKNANLFNCICSLGRQDSGVEQGNGCLGQTC